MKKQYHIIIAVTTLLLFLGCEIKMENIKAPEVSKEGGDAKAFNKELIIDINGDSIAGYALIALGQEPKETIILIPGYPGNDNNFDVAQEIRKSGKNVIHFNHRGAWGSQGVYSYSNCLEDIDEIIDHLKKNEVAITLRIDTTNFTVLGRSYGGGIALIKGSENEAIKKIIAISSVNYGEIMKRYHTIEELGGFRRYMEKQVMMKHDIDLFLQELLDNKTKYDITNYKVELANKKVLFIEDSEKNRKWIDKIENSTLVLLESDHNFIDKRRELSGVIVNWLRSN